VPIGSASIACVYQAVLKNGKKVAVKVRRPNVHRLLGADLRAMEWFLNIAEGLTLMRPGVLRNFITDFETTYKEELDFQKEARYQEIFRRHARKKSMTPRRFVTAPRVFFEYSSTEVLVQEFVTGVWMWELLAAVEQKDAAAIERMHSLNIDPKVVARRLIWINQWSTLGTVLFHADPHPANIIVQRNNKLVFIDFGACGSMDRPQQEIMLEVFKCQARKDVYGMTQATMAMLEPLAHVDVDQLQKELEQVFYRLMYGAWSKHSPWYEQTTASLWFGFLEVARRYELPVHRDAVRAMRATLLYDTVAFRLHNDLRINERLRFVKDFVKQKGKETRREVFKRIENLGPLIKDYAQLGDLIDAGGRMFYRMKSLLNAPVTNFTYTIEKSVFAILMFVRLFTNALGLTALVCCGDALMRFIRHQRVAPLEILLTLLKNGWYQALLSFMAILTIRRIMFRLNDFTD
jgi:ubiquinone biosynthesis protein